MSFDSEQEIPKLCMLVQDVLQQALQYGATTAEAGLSIDQGLSVTARMGTVETIEFHRDQGLGVTVYIGQRKGSASSTDLSAASLREAVASACSIARYASEDDCAGLPDPALLAKVFPDLSLHHAWDLTPQHAIEQAVMCEDAARQYDSAITNSEGATLTSHQGLRVFGNSLGFLHGFSATRHSLSCAVIGQRDDSMQRDYWYSVARHPQNLDLPAVVGQRAAQRALRRLGARSLTTRRCPVVFEAEVAASLFGAFINAISGGSLYRKSSFLLDSLGTQVFPSWMHIYEQPHLPCALGSASYDAEGVATTARDIVSEGIVRSYVLSSYSARKLGMMTTGNAGGVHNLTIDSGEMDLPAILREMQCGLLVTELMGQGVNRVTGDYSRGAAGFWVENGEIQFPVEEITIAGNLKNMFQHIVAVGNDVDLRGNIRCGSVWVAEMSVAGN